MKNTYSSEILAKDLGKLLNTQCSFAQGASILTLKNGREVWLESPQDSALFVIHTELQPNSSHSIQELSGWLQLNASTDIMKGAFISIHKESQSVRLCTTVPVELIKAELTKVLIENLIELTETLQSKKAMADTTAIQPARANQDTFSPVPNFKLG